MLGIRKERPDRMANVTAPPANPLFRIGVDMGPLLIFFVTYLFTDIFVATGAIMVATVIAVLIGYVGEKRIARMPLISGILLMVFGGMTLMLQDIRFLYVKPTIVYLLFASILFVGLLTGRPLLKFLLQEAFDLTEEGWSKLTWRWTGCFVLLAGLNEIVWRNFSQDFWVSYKVFGVLILIAIFTSSQIPMLTKHTIVDETTEPSDPAKPAEEPSPPQ